MILWINGAFGSGKTQTATIRKRLHSRMEWGNSWAAQQIPACLSALNSPVFENKIQTDTMSIPEVAEEIASRAGLSLRPRLNPFMQLMAQISTQLRAIRN